MSPRARLATEDDVAALAALSAARRRQLAGWAPVWWRVADGADELHPLWLGHLVTSEGPVARVVDDDGEIVAGAIAVPQGPSWFVDDVVATTDDAAACLLAAVTERPALTCVPTADVDGTRRAGAAGLERVASYWIGPTGPSDEASADRSDPADEARPVDPVPPHTFGPALADERAGALLVAVDGVGRAWGSGPLPPPPIYGAGGTVAVVTAVEGPDRAAALAAVRRLVAARGDVLVALVVGVDDTDLAAVAEAAGLERTVDVRAWPA